MTYCTLCGAPLYLCDILDSPNPEPRSMFWNYRADVLLDGDVQVNPVFVSYNSSLSGGDDSQCP